MELNEKKWSRINRLFLTEGERVEISDGVRFTHSRVPFEFHCRDMRVDPRDDVFDVRWYRHFEWVGRDWLARRTYLLPEKRPNPDVQTSYTLEGDIGHAEEDMVLALLLIKAKFVP